MESKGRMNKLIAKLMTARYFAKVIGRLFV